MNNNEKIKTYIKENCIELKCLWCETTQNLFKDKNIIGGEYFCLNCLEKYLENDCDFLED